MSLNRQRPRTRVNSRANTLPSLSNTTISTDATAVTTTEFLPSIEESLQDWLTRSIPDTPSSSVSWLLDTCRCCNQNECENLAALSSAIRKLEADSRLAAEIGQSLLHKHELFVSESNDIKNGLEQEVEQLRDKVRELETTLSEADIIRQDLLQEKDKSIWEWQKTQKVLKETAVDLETSNHRCLQLGSELKAKIQEVEKLRIFKFMVRQADIREDSLRAKLEDIKQELAVSRKTELTLESKYKKLKTKYESLCLSFEKIKLDQQEMGMTKDHQLDLIWLRESNEKLRKDVLKLTSALLVPSSADDLHMTTNTNSNYNNNLIELIKELASANNKLKTDLLDCSDLLMECRNDLYAKLDQQEQEDEVMHNDDTNKQYKENNTGGNENNNKWLSTSAPQSNEESIKNLPRLLRRTESKRSNLVNEECNHNNETGTVVAQQDDLGITENISTNNMPQPFISLPIDGPPTVVHHHYHYYMRKRLMAEKGSKNKQASGCLESVFKKNGEKSNDVLTSPPTITLSPSVSEKPEGLDLTSPFHQLYNQVTTVLQRLQQTDIRALNRRLRRAFDIFELSSMSNSIIENIVTDVEGLRTRFLWIEDCHSLVKQEPWVHDISMLDFFPLMELVQEMLKEIGQLRTTMNDLQVEYVKKVEESDIRLEEELFRKQQEQQQRLQQQLQQQRKQSGDKNENGNRVTLGSWLSNVFQRKNLVEPDQSPSLSSLQQQHQTQSNNRFILNNNSSDISVTTTNSSIHPLCIPPTKATSLLAPSSSNNTVHSTSEKSNMIAIIRRKKSDIDRFGPPSSFPTRSPSVPIGNEKNKRRSATPLSSSSNVPLSSSSSNTNNNITHNKPITLRASQSAGTVRRSKSMQAPALEYVVRRKRSTLGLSSSSSTDYDLLISPQTTSSDMTGTFATSWLGNK